jgi:Tol biopolymer transport system component
MSPERWRQVREAFERAVAGAPESRRQIAAEACEGDASLLREVESLLEAHSAASGFLDTLPRARFSPEPLIGRSVGRYQVEAALGAGGMGIVYRAYDPQLDRRVAFKILPPDGATAAAGQRFVREAQAASALNHPNIVTIYDTGADAGISFIAMELVRGETLAHQIARAPLPAATALRYAAQIASALAAAHRAGIVHRDIKPGNIMVSEAGELKVLDFGLAREEGVGFGTVSYMSPEQAEGKATDARSDLFSFGCTLYEMLTGRRAYRGGAGSGELPPMTRQIPAVLRTLLEKCLESDPADRFPSAAELEKALRAASARMRRRYVPLGVAAIVAVLILLAAAWYRARPAPGSSQWVQLTRLPDSVSQPALSADGRKLTFVRGPDTFAGAGQVYVKTLPSGDPVQLTHDTLQKMSPVFTPDGSGIAYTTVDRENQWDTWVARLDGGEPRRWMANASGLSWMRGGRILFSRILDHDVHMAVVAAGENGAGARSVYVPENARAMAHRSYASPDGKWALLVEMDAHSAWLPCRLAPMDGSGPARAVGPPEAGCTSAAWSPDGKWMYLSAAVGGTFHIWRQRFGSGAAEQFTSGPTEEEGIAMAADGRSLVTSVGLRQSPVWVHDSAGERQVSLEGYSFDPKFTPDGERLCYRVLRGILPSAGPSELQVLTLKTGRIDALLPGLQVSGGLTLAYDISSDGREVVAAAAGRDGVERLWRAPLDGSGAPQAIGNLQGLQPLFLRDGRVLFRSGEGVGSFAYSAAKDGSDVRRLETPPVVKIYGLSPDGQWLVAKFAGSDGSVVTALPLSGGTPLAISPGGSLGVVLKWAPDGKRIYISWPTSMFWEHGGRTYAMPLQSGRMLPEVPAGGFAAERQVAALAGALRIPAFDVAPGPSEEVYAYARETSQRNLYRIPIR